jgi:site-specific DNA-methyltransferase (adenine-specific)
MTEIYRKGPVELRLGRYQDVLADVEPDAVITDPPYSERTHSGHDNGATLANRGSWPRGNGGADLCRPRQAITYKTWTTADVRTFCEEWREVSGWIVALSDSVLCGAWRAELEALGRTGFQPLPCVIAGMTVRLAGDGPSSWAVYANVARPKALCKWGTLRGAYTGPQADRQHIGSKPLWLMRALVRDYSRPGDLVCDPCAGGGTTLIAAALEGRRAIGAEMDPDTFEKACKRIERHALTPPLPGLEAPPKTEQGGLF